MKSIFTYPNNAGTSYIHPDYVGDANSGFQKRVQDLIDGDYKAWMGDTTTATVTDTMTTLGRFYKAPELNESSGENTFYKFWLEPVWTADLAIVSKNITSANTGTPAVGDPITFDFGSLNHGFHQGERFEATNFDSTLTSINGNTYYAKKISNTEIQLATDSELTKLLQYDVIKQDTGITATVTNSTTPFTKIDYTNADGNLVDLSGFDGAFAQFNGDSFYVQRVDDDVFNLSWDQAGTELLRMQVLTQDQELDDIGFDNDGEVTFNLDVANSYLYHIDSARLVFDEVGTLVNEKKRFTSNVLAGSEDGEYMIYGGKLSRYNSTNNEFEKPFTGFGYPLGNASAIAVSGDGSLTFAYPAVEYLLGFARGAGNNTGDEFFIYDNSTGQELFHHDTSTVANSSTDCVDMSYNGDVIVIGYPAGSYDAQRDKVKVWRRSGDTWSVSETLSNPGAPYTGDFGGDQICLSSDGNAFLTHTSTDHLVYRWSGSAWSYDSITKPSAITTSYLETSPLLSKDGNTLVVGGTGGIIVYKYSGGSWDSGTTVSTSDWKGYRVNKTGTVIRAINTTNLVEFTYSGGSWSQTDTVAIPDMLIHSTNPSGYLLVMNTDDAVRRTISVGGRDAAGTQNPYTLTYTLSDAQAIINSLNVNYTDLFVDKLDTHQYKVYSDRRLTTPATVSLPGIEANTQHPTTHECDIGDGGGNATTGTITENTANPVQDHIIQAITPATVTQGTLTISTLENNRYEITGVNQILPGNMTYKKRTGESTYEAAAQIKGYVRYPDSNLDFIFSNVPSATVSTNSAGRITDLVVNAPDAGRLPSAGPVMMLFEKQADTYTPTAPTVAEQQDNWNTADYWTNNQFNAAKEWPKTVRPASVNWTIQQPSSSTIAQNGTRYVRKSGRVQYRFECEYPAMTYDQFKDYWSLVQAANGTATTFMFPLQYNNTRILFPANSAAPSVIRVLEDELAGDSIITLEGYPSSTTDAIRNGDMFVTGGSNNGNLITAIHEQDANAYGEVKFRISHPLNNNIWSGSELYANPGDIKVTLDTQDTVYTVDTAGYYYLTVAFMADYYK